jgi:hypothetical protein
MDSRSDSFDRTEMFDMTRFRLAKLRISPYPLNRQGPRERDADKRQIQSKECNPMARRAAAKASVTKAPVTKKPAKENAAVIKPVKESLTKSALINLIAQENEIPRKTAVGVYVTLENLLLGSVHPRGLGEFTLPGLLKINLRKVPARKAGTLVRNPATGEMIKAAAKPASARVKIRALSKLRAAAAS